MQAIATIFHLGVKELRSLFRDWGLLALIVFAFTISIYSAARALPETLNKAPIAIVDEDRSQLSGRIMHAFRAPYFLPPKLITQAEMDRGMDTGEFTFTLDIPPDFQADVLAGRQPVIQLNVDATKTSQAFAGAGYIQNIVTTEIDEFVRRYRATPEMPVNMAVRMQFNPNLTETWFGSVMQLINQITMLSIIITGAAVIRERESGTIEHLLVMPVTAFEIMVAKIWSMGLVILVAAGLSLWFVVKGWLGVPIHGSGGLFLTGVTLHLFATTSMGIFMGTVARSMPQLGLLCILILLPLQMLSGGTTPRESMPEIVQQIMLVAPTTHFVSLAQAILYRGADLSIVWPQFVALVVIGTTFFLAALSRFRKMLTQLG